MLREKETADDYRYFPEPDIPPLTFTKEDIENIRKELPALPQERKKQYMDLGLDEALAVQLIDQPELRRIFDAVYKKTNDAKRSSGLVLTQLLGFLKAEEKEISDAPGVEAMVELAGKIGSGTISANAGKDVLEKMVQTGKTASQIIEEEGMQQISDDSAIETLVLKAMDSNPQAIESFKKGKEAALGAIVGWVMKESKGQANPAKVNEILRKQLEN
ncbi:MAG: Aspartyl/glutamyl-tRNA(Asn/Gln) amidotransferase subunit B [Candidatus Peribacteria bacterium GW2011_GWB1_54_5]|nr:MAG: Aspartyl/glutamyl-tRNA(Asn/Gln) amidotransferase subunit B [Candidatus Peribacteria bacterium GW2011_GWB1_54_5]